MEDAATAEISRSQIWQWVHNGVILDDGRPITRELVRQVLDEELVGIRADLGDRETLNRVCALFTEVSLADDFVDFLTLPADDLID
jgi:malate synthase